MPVNFSTRSATALCTDVITPHPSTATTAAIVPSDSNTALFTYNRSFTSEPSLSLKYPGIDAPSGGVISLS